MDISICIVSWNTKKLLYDCLKSIQDKTSGVQYEIIVVDNASADGSADMVRQEFPDCKFIASKTNLGFVKGNNLAVSHASGKYILYLNPDTTLVTNAVLGMYRFLEKHPKHGATGCKLIYPNGIIQYTCASDFPTPWNTLSALLFLNRIFPTSKFFAARELDYWAHEDSRDIQCLSGACIMARKEIIDKIGGFDENIFMYSEDLDLCFQILKEGWKIHYLSTEIIVHHEGASAKLKRNRNFASLRQKSSNYYFFRKNYGALKAVQFRMVVFAGTFFRLALMILAFPFFIVKKNRNYIATLNKHFHILLWTIHNRTTT